MGQVAKLNTESATPRAPGTFAEDFIRLQAAIKPAIKDAENEAFKRGGKASRYADLGAVWDAIKDPLKDNGFAVIQMPQFEGETMFLETILLHISGEKMTGRYPLRPAKPDPQGFGSAITYARRYALSAMLGVIADVDDDGNAASGLTEKAGPAPIKSDDPDVIEGAKNWIEKQQAKILEYSELDQLTGWLNKHSAYGGRVGNWDRPTPGSDLDKMLKHFPELFRSLKAFYMDKLREV